MTRQDFDRYFAASDDAAEGYSADQLAEINAAVFAAVEDLPPDDEMTREVVKSAFDREFNAR